MAIIQSDVNPLAPVTTPTFTEQSNAYAMRAAAIRGEAQTAAPNTANPFGSGADKSQQDQQNSHISAMEQFLAPIGMNKFDNNADYTDEKHKKFANNLIKDPAFQEFEGPLTAYLSDLKSRIDQGHISQQDAIEQFAQWGQQEIDPILDKHHGKHSASHNTTLHDDEQLEMPDIVKRAKARGGK
ncbi:hypothetical protein IHZ75_004396 [Salmonella enterica]|nr:hypothetical protein [Salmonella enterica]